MTYDPETLVDLFDNFSHPETDISTELKASFNILLEEFSYNIEKLKGSEQEPFKINESYSTFLYQQLELDQFFSDFIDQKDKKIYIIHNIAKTILTYLIQKYPCTANSLIPRIPEGYRSSFIPSFEVNPSSNHLAEHFQAIQQIHYDDEQYENFSVSIKDWFVLFTFISVCPNLEALTLHIYSPGHLLLDNDPKYGLLNLFNHVLIEQKALSKLEVYTQPNKNGFIHNLGLLVNNCDQLEDINLSNISIQSLKIETLTQLNENLPEMPKIRSLDISDNRLGESPSEPLYRLEFLKKFPKLQALNLSANSFGFLTPEKWQLWSSFFETLPKLTQLDLSDNALNEILARGLSVDVIKKSLLHFKECLTALPCLEELNLSGNNLFLLSKKLFPLLDTGFPRLPLIKTLKLEHNSFRRLSAGQWVKFSVWLTKFPNLKELSLKQNELGRLSEEKLPDFCSFLRSLSALKHLDLSENKLNLWSEADLEQVNEHLFKPAPFQQVFKLHTVNLTANDFDKLNENQLNLWGDILSKLPNLQVLDLRETLLNDMNVAAWEQFLKMLAKTSVITVIVDLNLSEHRCDALTKILAQNRFLKALSHRDIKNDQYPIKGLSYLAMKALLQIAPPVPNEELTSQIIKQKYIFNSPCVINFSSLKSISVFSNAAQTNQQAAIADEEAGCSSSRKVINPSKQY